MIKIPFENGVKSTNAYVTIDGINHDVTDAVYTGDTPLSAENLNQMQENIEQSTVAINSSEPTTSEKVWFRKSNNLIDLRNFDTKTINGITFVNNKNGTVTLNGTSTEAFGISFFKYNFKPGTYSFNNKCDNQNVHLYFYSYDLLQTIIDENQTITLTEEKNNVGLDTYIQQGETFNNAIIKPMLSLGNQQEFEPYVDNNIYVKNNDGVFENFSETIISDSKEPNAGVWFKKGKNLINKIIYGESFNEVTNSIYKSNQWARTDFIEIELNVPYIFSHQLNSTNGKIATFDKNYNWLGDVNGEAILNSFTITNSNVKYIMVNAWFPEEITPLNESWMQLEQNTIATEPEAYIEKEILVKNDNGIYEQFYSEKQNLSYNMCENLGYFSTIDVNNVSKVGNLVQVTFRGLAGKDIPNNTGILRLPYGIAVQGMCLKIGIGQQYTYEEMRWGYANISTNNEIRIGGDVSTGRWIHIDFVYIANQ